MSILAHQEDGRGLRPRHPVVCLLDLIGVSLAFTVWLYRPELSLLLLPAAIAAQYGISCAYHWLSYNKTIQAIDHLMIAVLISATYIQYWICSMPFDEASWRIWLLGVVTVGVLVVRLVLPTYGKLRGALYLVLGFGGLAMSLMNPHMLPFAAWVGFLSGIGMYFLQFLVFVFEKPNPSPSWFGYRELQHLILLGASGLHLVTAVIYF